MFWPRKRVAITAFLLAAPPLAAVLWGLTGAELERVWPLVANTFLLAAATCALSLPPGALLAFLLSRTDMPCRRAAWALVAAMLFVPLYFQAAGWEAGFGAQGWIWRPDWLAPLLTGWRAAIWIHAMAAIPWVTTITAAGLRCIDAEVEEAAVLDHGPRVAALRITLPLTLPVLAVASLWVTVTVAGEMTVTDLFRVRTFSEEIYTGFALGEDWMAALGRSVPGIWLLACLGAAAMLLARAAPPIWRQSPRAAYVFRLGKWRPAWLAFTVAVLAVVAAAPLANLVVKAGLLVHGVDGGVAKNWSPAQFAEIVGGAPFRYAEEFGWTLLLAGLGATLATGAAVFLSWPGRSVKAAAWRSVIVSGVCLALPAPLAGILLIELLNRPESPLLIYLYDQTLLAPTLAVTIRALPLATFICWQAWRSIPVEILENARLDGAGSLRRLFIVSAPLRFGALASAWLASFAIANGDLAASILVTPPGVATVATRTFGLLHSGVFDQVAGLCLVSGALAMALSGCVAAFISRRQHG